MIGRIILILTAAVALGVGLAWWTGQLPFAPTTEVHADGPASPTADAGEDAPPPPVDIGGDLYNAPASPAAAPAAPERKFGADPFVIPECVVNVGEQAKQDVPAQRDGVILFIGTNVSDEEWAKLPQERRVEMMVAGKMQKYRRLQENDQVTAGQLMAVVDDRVAFAEFASKQAKVKAAEADKEASEAMANEAKSQYETSQSLHNRTGPAAPKEDVNTRKATWIRYREEAKAKATAIVSAEKEAEQAQVVLGQHEIHSSIPGVIKTIFKNPGEAVKSQPSYEPVFQIVNLKKLRAEGLVEEQYLPYLKKGMKVVVEHTAPQRPMQTLSGHFQEVTGVAVTKDAKRVVSGSLDGTVRVWDRGTGFELRTLRHPTDVKAVACTPAAAKANLCLSGGKDGAGRLWDLDSDSTKPLRTLNGKHRGAINCVAFSPDGAVCATGGDDREIMLWDTATGGLKYRLLGHAGAVTSIQFTPDSHLVSAARDGTLRVWKLGTEAGRQEGSPIQRRSGDVAQLGVSPDGKYALFDPYQSKALKVVKLPQGLMVPGGLKNPSGAGQFNTLAQFAPDGQTILTAGSDGRLQLWRSPLSTGRAYVLRQLESEDRSQPACGAFSPDGRFVVAGMKDKNVLVWPVPKKEEVEKLRTATIVYIDPAIDTSSHQTRIWADLDDAEGFSPGTTVTVVKYPEK